MNSIRLFNKLATNSSVFPKSSQNANSIVLPSRSSLSKRRFAFEQDTTIPRGKEIKPPVTVLQSPLSEKLKFPSTHPLRTLRRKLAACTAQQLMKEKEAYNEHYVVDIEEDATVYDAVKLMAEKNIGTVLVKDPFSKEITGIFTERDYIQKLILIGRLSQDTLIKDVMSRDVVVAGLNFSLEECVKLMAEKGMRHLPITEPIGDDIDEDYRVVGVISAIDIIKYIVKNSNKEEAPVLKETMADVFEWIGREHSEECYVQTTDSVYHSLELMKAMNVGGVFVTESQQLVGMFTERDYVMNIILKGRTSKTTQVGEVMHSNIVTVTAASTVFEILDLMANTNIQTLPVVQLVGMDIDDAEKDTLIGMITTMDVLKFLDDRNAMDDIETELLKLQETRE